MGVGVRVVVLGSLPLIWNIPMGGIGFKSSLRGILGKWCFLKKGNDFFWTLLFYSPGLLFGFYGSKCLKVYEFFVSP